MDNRGGKKEKKKNKLKLVYEYETNINLFTFDIYLHWLKLTCFVLLFNYIKFLRNLSQHSTILAKSRDHAYLFTLDI